MTAATLLALIGVSRPIYHLLTSNDAILIVQTYNYVVALRILFHGPNKITLSVCLRDMFLVLAQTPDRRDQWRIVSPPKDTGKVG